MTIIEERNKAFTEYYHSKKQARQFPPTSKEHHQLMKKSKDALKEYKRLGGTI